MSADYKQRMKGKHNPNFKKAGWKKCLRCEKEYHTYNKDRKFCSQSCFRLSEEFIEGQKRHLQTIKKRAVENRAIKLLAKNLVLQIRKPYLCLKCKTDMGRNGKSRKYCKNCSAKGNSKIVVKCETCGIELTRWKKRLGKISYFDEFVQKNAHLDIKKDKIKLFYLAMDYSDFWDENNLQVLCKKCNFAKELEFRKAHYSNRSQKQRKQANRSPKRVPRGN